MAFVISLLNQKGGAGKTTNAINLARGLQLLGHSVTLLDSDRQGSARKWKMQDGDEFIPVCAIDTPTIHKSISAISSVDVIVIDGAPTLEDMSASAIKASDLVIIPVQPSPLDVWATAGLVDMVKQRIEITDEKLKAAFLISRAIANTSIGKEIRTVLESFELPVLDTVISQYVDYTKCLAAGKTVFDYSKENSPAFVDAWALANEINNKYLSA